MKTNVPSILAILSALSLGAVTVPAQSPAPLGHASRSVTASGEASGEGSAAAAGSAANVVRTAVAVPLWTLGGASQASGQALSVSGAASDRLGRASMHGADKVWDPATGDPAARPPLDRAVGVPPAKAVRAQDPSPAEAVRKM